MSQAAAEWVVLGVSLYFGFGALFALALVCFALPRLDQAASHAPWGFRVLLIPGAALFWPLLLRRLLQGKGVPPQEHNAHLDALPCDSRSAP